MTSFDLLRFHHKCLLLSLLGVNSIFLTGAEWKNRQGEMKLCHLLKKYYWEVAKFWGELYVSLDVLVGKKLP